MRGGSAGGGALRHLEVELARLEEEGLLRVPLVDADLEAGGAPSSELLVLCSNDYLGYASEPLGDAGMAELAGVAGVAGGAGASRLVSGDHEAHRLAERELAGWVGMEAALLFSSGYAANVGVVSALARPGDRVISDALNHASLIDGCRLSGAAVSVTAHCDAGEVERALAADGGASRRRWVITESYFSMDGDIPDLARLRSVCDAYDAALIVDEAHALGVFGPGGAGLCAEARVRADVVIATLGKALGVQGAFVAGSPVLRTYLWNRARSFVFSTGVSPLLAAAVAGRARRAASDEAGRRRLHRVSAELREGLSAIFPGQVRGSRGPVLPLLVGASSTAVDLSKRLRARGVLVQAIRPPTVPRDTARLRITASAGLSDADVARALDAFAAVRG
jgi:8-amino-7-oxononanoate synthase